MIEPLRLAGHGIALSGSLPIARMRRLAGQLCDDAGEAGARLRFERRADGSRTLQGQVSAGLRIRCQRCLEPMEINIDTPIRLRLVSDPSGPAGSPDFDDLPVGTEPLSLVTLIEDELLLALPIAPMHEPRHCAKIPGFFDAPPAATRNPFTALAKLRRPT
ncbi:MAG: YceD family protein [Gammaproteobacteria bacterium]